MSYILDALKRADAERERGQVPGLHSQAGVAAGPGAEPVATTPVSRGRVATVAVLALATAVAALWWWLSSSSATEAVPAVAPATSPASLPGNLPAGGTAPPEPTQAMAPPQPPQPLQAPVPPAPAPILAPEPVPPAPAAAAASAPPTVAAAATPASKPMPAAAADAAPDRPDTARRFGDLTPEQRAQLPQLSVNGASYSANPAHRLLIVNGAVVQEGQEIAPGLSLERIGPHEAVLNHQGLRFRIGY